MVSKANTKWAPNDNHIDYTTQHSIKQGSRLDSGVKPVGSTIVVLEINSHSVKAVAEKNIKILNHDNYAELVGEWDLRHQEWEKVEGDYELIENLFN